MKSTVAWMLLGALSLTSCAPTGPASNYCDIAKPIYFDPADRLTERTERAIIAHNEKGASICGWR